MPPPHHLLIMEILVVFMVRRRMQDADLCSLHCLGVRWKTTGYSSGTGTGTLLYLVGQRGRKYFFLPLKLEFLTVSGNLQYAYCTGTVWTMGRKFFSEQFIFVPGLRDVPSQ